MTYQILTSRYFRQVENTPAFGSVADAEAYIRETFKNLAYFEVDADNDAADFITTNGTTYVVEAR